MNQTIMTGRIASDLEMKTTQSGVQKMDFRLAVPRRFKDQNGERQTDFFDIVAWRHNAEFIHKFFHKGDKVLIKGALEKRVYQAQDGTPRYVTEIRLEEIEGLQSAQGAQGKAEAQAPAENQGFTPIEDDSELPF